MPQVHLGLAVPEMRPRGIATERVALADSITAYNTKTGLRSAAAAL